ncbi:peptidyl-prolyl cis-trans isomerase [Candidatus Eisenbacteria bacterium]|uniref:Peptidyl-prolyl cis-trans isomerase n=1 Tax=Eiseniibacteriota bacterium TaxID=2212470 RepID=A0ABV6YQN9_UNCEI
MMKRLTGLAVLGILVAFALSCGSDGTIASGGDFALSLDDLRYEISQLGPSASYSDSHADRLGIVEMLSARHYLAREAEARGYGDEALEQAVVDARKVAAAEAYHEWKLEKSIQTPRIQRLPWLPKLDRKLHIVDMHFLVYEVAEEALAEVERGRPFEKVAAEAKGREDITVNDMDWRVWKELTLEVANVVFRLDVNEVSPIVRGADGYHLFYLAGAEKLGLGMEIQSLRSRKFLTALKEERLLEKERAELVRGYDVSFSEDGLAAALRTFAMAFKGERPDDDLMGGVVSTHPEGQVLVGDLFSTYFSVPNDSRPYVGDRRGIREMAIDLMMPELEAMAAFDMGFARSRQVKWAEKQAREDYLVVLMEDYFRSEIAITEDDLQEYYEDRREDLKSSARYKVSRILTSTADDARSALRRVESGEDFLEVSTEMAGMEARAEVSGELEWLTTGSIAVFDSALAGLDPGEMTGIFESGSGFEILRLDDWRALANLAGVLQAEGDLEAAAETYERAVGLNPDDRGLLLALSGVYAEMGDEDRAGELMGRADLGSDDDIITRYNRAAILQDSGDLEEAGRLYEAILLEEPRHEGSLVNLGVVYARTGKEAEALDMWKRALEVNPENRNAKRNIRLLESAGDAPGPGDHSGM